MSFYPVTLSTVNLIHSPHKLHLRACVVPLPQALPTACGGALRPGEPGTQERVTSMSEAQNEGPLEKLPAFCNGHPGAEPLSCPWESAQSAHQQTGQPGLCDGSLSGWGTLSITMPFQTLVWAWC